jgi:predicted transcriptional regulator
MDIPFAPHLEEKLRALAATSGREPHELVQDVVADYVDELDTVRRHIEEGFLQAEHGDLIDGDQVRRDLQVWKGTWRPDDAARR